MSDRVFEVYDSSGNLVAHGVLDSNGAPLDLDSADVVVPNQYTELFESDDVLIFDPNGLRSLKP